MNRRGGAAAAVAAVLGILFTLFTPSPAAAAAAGSFATPETEGQVYDTSAVHISGGFEARDGGRFEGPVVLDVADQHFEDAMRPEGGPFGWPVTIPANGNYTAVVKVMFREWPYQVNAPYPVELKRMFTVEAKPAAVTGLTVVPKDSDRTIKVSWKPNAEPDLVAYLVSRSFNSKTAYADLGSIKAGAPTSFVDKLTDNDPAGTYRYRVVAVRRGATAESEGLSSPTTTSKDAVIKAQPASGSTTPTTAGPGGATAPGQPAGSRAAAPLVGNNGKVDIGKLNNLLSQPTLGADSSTPGPNLTSEPELLEEEDGGFSDRLPYGPDGIPGTEDDGEGEMNLGVDEPVSSSSERPTTLLSLGGAALAAMLVALTRYVLNEVKRSEDELEAVPAVHIAIATDLVPEIRDVNVEEDVDEDVPMRAARPLRSPMRPPRRERELVGSATE